MKDIIPKELKIRRNSQIDFNQLMDKEDINGKYIQLIGKRLSVESCLE